MSTPPRIVVTGLGTVSAFGPRRGPITGPVPELQAVTRWPTEDPRRARLVPAFQPGEVVPGLKTRRMDRLSVCAIVAANLAIQDASLRTTDLDAERVGVTFGTAFGCIELTEAFMVSIARNGHAKADPILFPETLCNLPASHVARQWGFKGPNVTLSRGFMSGEVALIDAVAQLESGEVSVVMVMAGDVVSRGLFAWYEAAGRLAPECTDSRGGTEGDTKQGQLVPGEGVGVAILETSEHAVARGARAYASILGTALESRGATRDNGWAEFVSHARAASGAKHSVQFVIAGPGVHPSVSGPDVLAVRPHLEIGMFGGCSLVGLSRTFGLARPQVPGLGFVIGAAGSGQRSAVVLGLPETVA